MNVETMIKKAHIQLLNHPETALYAGVILFGKSTVVDDVPTACTNGIDCRYGREFMSKLTQKQVNGVALHENLHKALRHLIRYKKLMRDDGQLANAAMDYVVNSIIHSLKDKTLCELPSPHLYDKKFENWSVLEVFNFLKTGSPPNTPSNPSNSNDVQRGDNDVTVNGEKFKLDSLDEHDPDEMEDMDSDATKKVEEAIEDAIRQGSMIAGRTGAKVPRAIKESLVKPVDWKRVLMEFVSQTCKGRDDYTYRKFNLKRLVDDHYVPGVESEEIGELILAVDTSASISQEDLSVVASHVSHVCSVCKPSKVRVLWWDTRVHGEQTFKPSEMSNIRKLLMPKGGGGTHASCVRDYIVANRLKAECIIMFTDGWVENPVNWNGVRTPTLWLVDGNNTFKPPAGGRKVNKE